MRAEVVTGLRALAEVLPEGTAIPVPREVLLELLSADVCKTGEVSAVVVDLTVPELAVRFNRKPSSVRAWLERGDLPGAYKLHGREWRVPAASVEAFQARQREGRGKPKAAIAPGLVDLGAHRRVSLSDRA